jgi:hypothetical protein
MMHPELRAALVIQRRMRGLLARRELLRVARDPHEQRVDTLTILMMWEASMMTLMIFSTLTMLYNDVGPQDLWDKVADAGSNLSFHLRALFTSGP